MEGASTQRIEAGKNNPIVSDTKELTWYTEGNKNGLVTIESPKSQGLVGFVKAGNQSLGNLSAAVDNDFCAITVSSLDDQPIATSGQLLLTAGARVENTGLSWNERRTKPVRIGASPSLIEVVKGTIVLKRLVNAKSVSITALDGTGNPIHTPVQVVRTTEGWSFKIGDIVTTWYKIEVRR
jgi:hypothetical protein